MNNLEKEDEEEKLMRREWRRWRWRKVPWRRRNG